MFDIKPGKDTASNTRNTEQDTPAAPAPEARTRAARGTPATIGSSIKIKGDVTGDEDLVIEGQVEGNISLKGHNVTIGKNGKIMANIQANLIVIEGDLQGDLNGEEKVIIRETANVQGNIVSPRVNLEDGAMFKGSIEMEPRQMSVVEPRPSRPAAESKEESGRKTA